MKTKTTHFRFHLHFWNVRMSFIERRSVDFTTILQRRQGYWCPCMKKHEEDYLKQCRAIFNPTFCTCCYPEDLSDSPRIIATSSINGCNQSTKLSNYLGRHGSVINKTMKITFINFLIS